MVRPLALILCLLALGCGQQQASAVGRASDVGLAEGAEGRTLTPTPPAQPGFWARLTGQGGEAAPRPAPEEDALVAAVTSEPARQGFWGRMFGGGGSKPEVEPGEAILAAAPQVTASPTPKAEVVNEPRGFWGRMFGGGNSQAAEQKVQPETAVATALENQTSGLATVKADIVPEKPGFFASLFGGGQSQADVQLAAATPGTKALPLIDRETAVDGILTSGVIGKVCSYSRRKLGSEVDKAAGFKLYDSDPENLGPRSHFVTGFKDGCARKFTAGMVFLGDPLLHETKRYSTRTDYSQLDRDYEKIKARICRVAKRTPCTKNAGKLTASTVFVSIYRNFGDANSAGEILLYDGKLHRSNFGP